MAKTLDDIFDDDDFGLLNARETNSYVRTDEDRLIDSFEELNVFFEKNNREPAQTSMSEYALFARLKEWRTNPAKKSTLKLFDRYNLLGEEEPVVIESIDDILANDDFGLLDTDGDSSIFDFVHTPKSGSRADAEYIAQRKALPEKEFQRYDAMFKKVHQELKEGKRQLKEFRDAERNLKEGNFYLVDGLLCYLEISDVSKIDKPKDSVRLDGRTMTIFENGTISNMLFRSLGKAIQKNGKLVTDTDENIQNQLMENANIARESDEQSGWIYVLRSKSVVPAIRGIENLYKLGFSTVPVQERIKNASKEATYLFADVEEVASYSCYNLNTQALENLLHRFFAKVCVDIDVYDTENNRYTPREWFSVPLQIINEAIQLVQDSTIFNYRYDENQHRIVLR